MNGYFECVKQYSGLFAGATYKVNGLEGFTREIWICPVTLTQDKEKGMMLLKKACDCDCTDALNAIGMILNEEKRYDESFPYHKRSAEKGDMYGLHNLGNAYFYARGVERDVKKAFDLWTEAGDKGNPDSHFTIGNIFFRGEYVEQDIALAIKCYTFAANHPCTTQRMAMEQLVKAYQMIGNEKEAEEWNSKLSEIE